MVIAKNKCTGCSACLNICPQNSIKMVPDKEGFLYPHIDLESCVNCGLCKKACPVIQNNQKRNMPIKTISCRNNCEKIQFESSSGGIFTLLASYVLNKNGIVFGAAFNDHFKVEHTHILSKDEISKLRGSKYVQSDLKSEFQIVKDYLITGKTVLFSGTPCQVKGLKSFLVKDFDNLICIDFVCHGVPSPLVFKKYKDQVAKMLQSRIKSINFRDKKIGWEKCSLTIKGIKKDYSKTLKEDLYLKGFLANLYLRPSCYNCTANNYTSGSDITLADAWGIKEYDNKSYNINGVSSCLFNTKKGIVIFNEIKKELYYTNVELNFIEKFNSCIIQSVTPHLNRKVFFVNLPLEDDIMKLIDKSLKLSFTQKIYRKIRRRK